MKQKCLVCGNNSESEYCFRCKPAKSLNRGVIKKKSIDNSTREENNKNMLLMQEFFLSIWKERSHKSEISGEFLGDIELSIFFHHILPKKKYDVAKFDKDNIILLTLDEHSSVELNMYKYVKINYIREKLKLKYNL